MPASPDDAAPDREWQTLQRKIGRSRGFCYLVYFVADERAAARLKERLRDSLRAKTAHLSVIAVESPTELAAKYRSGRYSNPPIYRNTARSARRSGPRRRAAPATRLGTTRGASC